jgi:MSHA biogenesis protein MshK
MLVYLTVFMTPILAELNDPTRPASYALETQGAVKKAKGGMQVSSIIIGKQRRVAIIDGQAVQKGDAIRGMTVLAIKPSEVLLKSDNKELQVSLLPRKVKTPAIRKELQSEHE